jgi:hypothetical protein
MNKIFNQCERYFQRSTVKWNLPSVAGNIFNCHLPHRTALRSVPTVEEFSRSVPSGVDTNLTDVIPDTIYSSYLSCKFTSVTYTSMSFDYGLNSEF